MQGSIAKMLASAINEVEEQSNRPNVGVQKMAGLYMQEQEPFEAGDIVELKDGMEWAHWPKVGDECVVMEVLAERITPPVLDDNGKATICLPIDMVVGISCKGDFAQVYADSRRFKLKKRYPR